MISCLKAVLLCGGESGRMGSPTHLLSFNHRPLYQHLLDQIKHTSTTIQEFVISVHGEEQVSAIKELITVLQDGNNERIGPAAGLLAAHRHDDKAHWLVLACDYPRSRHWDLQKLPGEFEEPVTSFRNTDGFVEPLIGVGSPRALQYLEESVQHGPLSSGRAVKEL